MIKNIFRPAIWERIWKFTVQMQMQPMWFWKYHNATLLWEALSTHFNCDLCGKYTISDNVLGDHIEFYSDTEAFSTHSNCDLCGKYTFWHSTATQRRGTVSTYYNCYWCGKLHDSWQGFGTHRRETGSTYFNGDSNGTSQPCIFYNLWRTWVGMSKVNRVIALCGYPLN